MSDQPTKKPVSRVEFIASVVVGAIGLLLLVAVGICLFNQPEPLFRMVGGAILGMVTMCVAMIGLAALIKKAQGKKP